MGTDNIIISTFLGVVTVGLYSNYNLIIQALNNLFSQVFNSITASVGNVLVERISHILFIKIFYFSILGSMRLHLQDCYVS